MRRRPVRREPAHDLGGLHERVVAPVRHRSVPGRSAHTESAPGQALLADIDRDGAFAVRIDGRPPAEFGQHVVGVDDVPMVLGHPVGSPDAARLLVGHAEVDEVALGPEAFRGEAAEGDGHRRGQVQHVDRPAAPHLAVDHLAGERIVPPPVGVHRHHIGVGHEAQRWRVRIGPFDPGDQRVTSRSRGEAFDLEPCTFEVLHEQVGVPRLLAGVGRAVVDAFVADQRLQQFRGRAGELIGGRHAATVATGGAGGRAGFTRACGSASRRLHRRRRGGSSHQ